jgi:hypothetical protein
LKECVIAHWSSALAPKMNPGTSDCDIKIQTWRTN